MKAMFAIRYFTTDVLLRIAVLLFFMPMFFPSQAYADDNTAPTPMPLIINRPDDSALANADRHYHLGLLLDYMRREGPALISGLPDTLRTPANFIMGELKSTANGFGSGNAGTEDNGTTSSVFSPTLSLISPSDENAAEALWLTPGYHHTHGMLPFDDALTLGFNYRNAILDDRVKFSVHPFCAQSWYSTKDYWGTEMALDIGPAAGHSWGVVVIRYDNGNSDLMDHGRGIDMHADFSFDRHLTLTAGAQQNESSDLGNYVLLRWRLTEFGR